MNLIEINFERDPDQDGQKCKSLARLPLISTGGLCGIGPALVQARRACGLELRHLAGLVGIEAADLRRHETESYSNASLRLLAALGRELPVRLEVTILLERD